LRFLVAGEAGLILAFKDISDDDVIMHSSVDLLLEDSIGCA
jgi:hypothetical protein